MNRKNWHVLCAMWANALFGSGLTLMLVWVLETPNVSGAYFWTGLTLAGCGSLLLGRAQRMKDLGITTFVPPWKALP